MCPCVSILCLWLHFYTNYARYKLQGYDVARRCLSWVAAARSSADRAAASRAAAADAAVACGPPPRVDRPELRALDDAAVGAYRCSMSATTLRRRATSLVFLALSTLSRAGSEARMASTCRDRTKMSVLSR